MCLFSVWKNVGFNLFFFPELTLLIKTYWFNKCLLDMGKLRPVGHIQPIGLSDPGREIMIQVMVLTNVSSSVSWITMNQL